MSASLNMFVYCKHGIDYNLLVSIQMEHLSIGLLFTVVIGLVTLG